MRQWVKSDPDSTSHVLSVIYDQLLQRYGPQHWWPARTGGPWEIIMGAVLTQRTSWTNVERPLQNVVNTWGEEGVGDPRMVLAATDDDLAALLKPAGHYSTKPHKLKNLARFVMDMGGVTALARSEASTESLRAQLLSIWGIGPETADAILLYALGRPVFVADAYALRLANRWGLLRPDARYDDIQRLFTDHLPLDVALFNEYHALIVEHGRRTCRPRPLCEMCPLNQELLLRVEGEESGTWSCPAMYI